MFRLVIAGFRHGHVFDLFDKSAGVPDCAVCACCEEDRETRESLKSLPVFAGKPLYDDFQTMLREVECDAVGIGDYFGRRGSLAVAALKAGKHVIVDKPLCTDPDELSEIRALAHDKGLKVGLMLPLWSHGNTVAARDLIASGKLGEIQAVSFTGQQALNYGSRPGWYFEKGKQGGTINDMAPHGIDIVRFLTGRNFQSIVGARTWNSRFPEEPDFRNGGQFLAALDNGAGVFGDVSYFGVKGQSVPSTWRFTVWGTSGWLEFNFQTPGVTLAVAGTPGLKQVFPARPEPGYWEAFLADVGGCPGRFATDYILEVSEWSLKLQAAADAFGGK